MAFRMIEFVYRPFKHPHPYAQGLDDLFTAFEAGDENGAAAALRAAGSLFGFSIDYFADLLDPAIEPQGSAWCIRPWKTSKGRPAKLASTKQKGPFLRYLAIGKAHGQPKRCERVKCFQA